MNPCVFFWARDCSIFLPKQLATQTSSSSGRSTDGLGSHGPGWDDIDEVLRIGSLLDLIWIPLGKTGKLGTLTVDALS